MNAALQATTRRQQQLLARSAALRSGLALQAELVLAGPLQAANKAGSVVEWVRRHWPLVGGAAALLALAQPRRALAWGLKGFALWRLWRQLRAALR